MKYKVYNQQAEEVGNVDLSDDVFAVEQNLDLIHQAFVTQIANERQVLAHTKTRSEVRGGGRKPWKQKGTGRARAGSSRSPIWIGGGVTFGPTKDRNFSKKINIKMKKKALCMVLSDRAKDAKLVLVNEIDVSDYRTKDFDQIISGMEKKVFQDKDQKRSVLFINDNNDKARYSARNLAGLKVMNFDNLNIVDILKYRNIITSKKVAEELCQRYGKKNSLEKKAEKK